VSYKGELTEVPDDTEITLKMSGKLDCSFENVFSKHSTARQIKFFCTLTYEYTWENEALNVLS
jgi:hypothetical protein